MLNLDKNKTYLLACSYGPDSMALFDMLEKEGYNFSVAHVNYNLRLESRSETECLQEYCMCRGIQLYYLNWTDWENKGNVEDACRKIRYDFFKSLSDTYNFDAVLVAHNEDDLLETYLLQKKRKNLVKHFGLSKVSSWNGMTIVRPILTLTKQLLQVYCNLNNVPYCIDSSNLTDQYERNKIRHNIVSKMDDDERRKMLIEIEKENYHLDVMNTKLDKLNLNDINTLNSLSNKELAFAINRLVKEKLPNISVSLRMCLEIKRALSSEKPNVIIPFRYGYSFKKEYNSLNFGKNDDVSYNVIIKGPCEIDGKYFYINLNSDTSNLNICQDSYPITIRNIKPDDDYVIKGYIVKARRLMIDWKMPLSLRKRWPVIVDQNEVVIYIPRYRSTFKVNNSLNFYVK